MNSEKNISNLFNNCYQKLLAIQIQKYAIYFQKIRQKTSKHKKEIFKRKKQIQNDKNFSNTKISKKIFKSVVVKKI